MDEKGFSMGLMDKDKVFFPKKNLELMMLEPTNTKFLECISANSQVSSLYIIFKAKIMIEA